MNILIEVVKEVIVMFKRVFLLVLDGVGVGYAPDADEFGDKGANTLLQTLLML